MTRIDKLQDGSRITRQTRIEDVADTAESQQRSAEPISDKGKVVSGTSLAASSSDVIEASQAKEGDDASKIRSILQDLQYKACIGNERYEVRRENWLKEMTGEKESVVEKLNDWFSQSNKLLTQEALETGNNKLIWEFATATNWVIVNIRLLCSSLYTSESLEKSSSPLEQVKPLEVKENYSKDRWTLMSTSTAIGKFLTKLDALSAAEKTTEDMSAFKGKLEAISKRIDQLSG